MGGLQVAHRFEGYPEVQLNLNVRGMPPSATIAINEKSRQMQKEGREVYRLGLGQSPFPVPESVVEELRRNAHQKDYLPVKGLDELREAVAAQHRRDFDVECSADDVIVGPGSKELMFLLQLVYYGDIVIPTPAWVSYAPQARIIGRLTHFINTRGEDQWRFMPDQLEALCRQDPGRPLIVVLNYPSNPTGGTYTEDELDALAEVASNNKVVLLADEIYARLHHDGLHKSIVPIYPQGTIYSGGLSKWCGAGGWRLGLFVVPRRMRWLLDAMAATASETFTSTSAPIQYAAVRAFQGGEDIEAYLVQCRRVLKALGLCLAARLRQAGVGVVDPAGAFYLFPDFGPQAEALADRGIVGSQQLCARLLEETGVAILPGVDFGRPPAELTARLAYVNFEGERALAGARALPESKPLGEEFLREFCGPTLAAVERLCDWLRG
jgi:aspartate aminotransferase